MADEPDPLAAELDAIAYWQKHGDFRDSDRLLAFARRAATLAGSWHENRGTGYSAMAQCASDLRDALREELLSERRSGG